MVIEYFLFSILYFWGSSTALSVGIGYYTIYRPVVAGLMTGLILGNGPLGMAAGAVVNIIYIDFVSTGGSFKGDQCLTAIMAAIAAILFNINPIEAAALSYPFGYLGILVWKYRLNINSIFVKGYERQFNEGKNPSISRYNGLYPQLLLYIISTVVLIVAISVMLLFNNYIIYIRNILFYVGFFLVFVAAFNILYKLNNNKGIAVFILFLFITITLKPTAYLIFLMSLIFLAIIIDKKSLSKSNFEINKGLISKKDLVYSWFIWMNFSHSCYSYERLQGLAFAHSMKNIFKKLYDNIEEVNEAIHRQSEYFNTEPNIGTPIHGYIISLEEQKINEEIDISKILYLKKSMMGAAAGLGDSYTQVVLTPLFISMSVMLCLDNKFSLALLPIIILGIIILYFSYTGFIKGYYLGKESLIERVNIIKNSKVKKYFPYIFIGILGVSLGKLLLTYSNKNYETILLIAIISIIYTIIKNKRRCND